MIADCGAYICYREILGSEICNLKPQIYCLYYSSKNYSVKERLATRVCLNSHAACPLRRTAQNRLRRVGKTRESTAWGLNYQTFASAREENWIVNTKRRDRSTYEDNLKKIGPALFTEPCCEIAERSLSILMVQEMNVAWFCIAKMGRGVLQIGPRVGTHFIGMDL